MRYSHVFMLALALSTTACTTTKVLVVKPHIIRFETPEASGRLGKGSISFNLSKAPKYKYGTLSNSDFLGDTTTANTSEKFISSEQLGLTLSLGLLDRLDIFSRTGNALEPSVMWGLKYQIIGSPRQALEAGWKMSTSIAGGDYSYVETHKDFILAGSDDPVDLTSNGTSVDININTGYRFNHQTLSYINIFSSKTSVTGHFKTSTLDLKKERTHEAKGVLIGINQRVAKKVSLGFEVGYAKTTWSTLGSKIYTPAGVNLSIDW